MDIKELDKKQLILLVLLITFVVSIATGIITVSLMKQMPTSVPQTINNVIQRTIEKVTTVEVPAVDTEKNNQNDVQNQETQVVLGDKDSLVSIYLQNKNTDESVDETINDNPKIEAIGQGIIISDVGLILIDSNLINETDSYKVVLSGKDYGVSVLKKFNNGFSILKISPIITTPEITDTTIKTQE